MKTRHERIHTNVPKRPHSNVDFALSFSLADHNTEHERILHTIRETFAESIIAINCHLEAIMFTTCLSNQLNITMKGITIHSKEKDKTRDESYQREDFGYFQ